jgi:hypothetical protein
MKRKDYEKHFAHMLKYFEHYYYVMNDATRFMFHRSVAVDLHSMREKIHDE